jgi:hypothetical protein
LDKNSSFVLADGQVLNIPTINIDGGSTFTLSGNETITTNTLNVNGLNSTVTVLSKKILSLNIPNINIGSGSSISADIKGYGQNEGPGDSPTDYMGASYGGVGYQNISTSVYGSETQPVDFGSGGHGNYAAGGGAIRLIATNSLVNNGTISSNGNNTSSGGSVYVTANSISGSGIFQANGGGLYCPYQCYGFGSGGRVAIYYKTSSFTGTTEAKGGSGYISYPYMGAAQDGTVHIVDESAPKPSSDKQITAFSFTNLTPNVAGTIVETDHTISVTVPFETDITTLVPSVTISDKASISPSSTDAVPSFANPVTYTVTAEDKSTQNYIVTVTVAPDPNPIQNSPVTLSVTGYTLNGVADNITINPSTTPLSIAINASENVNWMSIKIEKQDNPNVYKIFQSGAGCADSTNTCTKSWNGLLTKGGLLQDGTYRIKLHIKDATNNEFYDYLSPYVINVFTQS